jgi:hypothetical protein
MFDAALSIADAVLFEGYLLYPYRASSTKNQRAFSFGTLLPVAPKPWTGSEQSSFRCEAVVIGADAELRALVRFIEHADADASTATVREIALPPSSLASLIAAPLVIESRFGRLHTRATLSAVACAGGARVALIVENRTACTTEEASQALGRRGPGSSLSLGAAHGLLAARDGHFVSAIDPTEHASDVARCESRGVWPVLVGDVLLASPIILPDQPRIAAESIGPLFDGTEIDEILSLRILTLTDDEKRELRAGDPRAAAVLDRVEAMSPEALARLHGTWRERGVRVGARVRLRPRGHADAMDVLLAGRAATVVAVERDAEGRAHVAVTIDDDPGRDLGAEGRKPGHRFYFGSDELEQLDQGAAS